MKLKNIKQGLREASFDVLKSNVEEERRALFMLRLSKSTSPVKDISQFKKLRRNIARILTFAHKHSAHNLI
jgi:ribosomal protein L29